MRHRERFSGDDDSGTGAAVAHAAPVSGSPNGSNGAAPRGQTRPADPLAHILDHGPDAICIHQNGRFVYFNAVAVRWLGARSQRELLGHNVSRFVHPKSVPLVYASMTALRRAGDVSDTLHATIVRVDGTVVDVEALSVLTTWSGAVAHQLILRDLTARRAAHDALVERAALVDNAGDAIISVSASGVVTSWNPAAERVYRRPAHRALARPIDVALGAAVDLSAISRAGGVAHDTHHAMDGSAIAVRTSATEYGDGYILVCSDESAFRHTVRNLRSVVNMLQVGIVVLEENGWSLTVNPAARQILGIGGDGSAVDGDHVRRLPIYDADGILIAHHDRPITTIFATGQPTINRVIGVDRPDGRRIWLSASCQLLHPNRRGHSPALLSFADITSQRAATEHLMFQARHDALTGLPNRAHILKAIDTLHRGSGQLRAVLFIDLDDLKTVNDTFGHAVGDMVLRTTAARLCTAVERNDIVGRLAGDEFVALLVGSLPIGDLDDYVEHVRGVLAQPIPIRGGTLRLGASIGIIDTYASDPRDAATLLRDADAAMYADKAAGRQISVFAKG